MEMGAVLGVVTWIIVGAIINSITKDVSQSFGPATIAGFLVFGYFYYKENAGEKGKALRAAKKAGPGPIVTSIGLEQAFGTVKTILAQSHFGQNWWGIKTIEPEAGRIMAIMKWREYFGDQVGELDREVVLTITFIPNEDSTTQVHLEWDLHSPLNRGQVNKVVEKTTEELINALT
jgi:hypothetical protein